MNPTILSSVEQTGIFNLGRATSLGEDFESKQVPLCLKIDLVSHPAHEVG